MSAVPGVIADSIPIERHMCFTPDTRTMKVRSQRGRRINFTSCASMSRRVARNDNAVMESFFAAVNKEEADRFTSYSEAIH